MTIIVALSEGATGPCLTSRAILTRQGRPMRCHASARMRPEYTHRATVLKPWLCFLVNTIIGHSSRGSSQPHDHSFRCGGGLEGAPCSLPKVSLGSNLTPSTVATGVRNARSVKEADPACCGRNFRAGNPINGLTASPPPAVIFLRFGGTVLPGVHTSPSTKCPQRNLAGKVRLYMKHLNLIWGFQ